jgi:hypothetical protein
MNAMDKDRSLDAVLDRALAACGDAEPRVGLENRILASLRDEDHRVASARRRFLVVGSAVAAVVLATTLWIVVSGTSPPNRRTTTARVSPAVAVTTPQDRKSERSIRTNQIRRHGRSRHPKSPTEGDGLPKLREFPSRRPLSGQEKLLLAYISAAPDSEIKAAAAEQASNASDLQINELEIAPLAGDQNAYETSTNK